MDTFFFLQCTCRLIEVDLLMKPFVARQVYSPVSFNVAWWSSSTLSVSVLMILLSRNHTNEGVGFAWSTKQDNEMELPEEM